MQNKTILIIGGTGALGKTLTRRYYKTNKIIILSRDEHKHVHMKREFPNAIYQIGDVKDKDSILQALNDYTPNDVINTAFTILFILMVMQIVIELDLLGDKLYKSYTTQ